MAPGTIIINDTEHQKQNIDDLRRDTTNTNTSLPDLPDLQELLREQLKTQQLYDDAAQKAAKMIGDKASDLANAALARGDMAEYEFWKEGGAGPAILHSTAGGLLGGVTDFSGMLNGAFGGASSALLAPKIHDLVAEIVKEAGFTGQEADFLTNSVTGSILQGTGGSYAGNAFQNNYLKHQEMAEANATRAELLKEIAECKAEGASGCSGQTLANLEQRLDDSTTYYRSLSDENNANLIKACQASMTSLRARKV